MPGGALAAQGQRAKDVARHAWLLVRGAIYALRTGTAIRPPRIPPHAEDSRKCHELLHDMSGKKIVRSKTGEFHI